jgi:beta-glucanase (GH16 family)
MKKKLFFLFFFLQILRGYAQGTIISLLPDSMPLNDIEKKGWMLIFQDEFDGDTLDTQKWWCQEGLHGTELQYYRNHKNNVFVKDGFLYIKAIRDTFKNMPYTSALLMSSKNFDRESLVEVRCKIPKGKGLWPAFWFWRGARDSTYQEIDAFEFWGDNTQRFSVSNHYWDKAKQTISTNFKWVRPRNAQGQSVDMSKDFFVYTVYWDDKNIKLLLNNRLAITLKDNVPVAPFPIILNLAVDGGKGKMPDKNTVFPAEFIIDYVRVYKRNTLTTN